MENELTRLSSAETFAACEALWKTPDARAEIDRLFDEAYATLDRKVVVLDDDPTGVQTAVSYTHLTLPTS